MQLYDDPIDVVADLDLGERVDAVRRELAADPRRVGIDDLPSSSSVPMASTSQRIAVLLGGRVEFTEGARDRRRLVDRPHLTGGPKVLGTADEGETTAAQRNPFHSHVASSAVSGSNGEPTAQLLAERLVLRQSARRHADARGADDHAIHADGHSRRR
jgi:hypothetical protein